MTTYHARGQNGSDSGDGLTFATAFLTLAKLATVMVAGDKAYLSEIFRVSADAVFTNLSGSVFYQEPGQTQYRIAWETLAGTGWASGGGNLWTKTLPAGLGSGGGSSAIGGQFFAPWQIGSDGRPTGHLRYVAGAGGINQYDYNNATGATTINVASSPNGTTADVSYSSGAADVKSVRFEGGTGITIDGGTFGPQCSTGSSYSLMLHNCAGSVVSNSTFYDAQWHHAGFLNHDAGGVAAAGNQFVNCTFYGGAPGLGHSVHYAQSTSVPASGTRWSSCTFHSHRYLDPTGTVVAGQSAMAQIGAQGHSDGTAALTDTLISGCTFIEWEPGWSPVSIANQPAVAASWIWASFPARMDLCVLRGGGSQTGISTFRPLNALGVRRTIFDARNAGPSGLCRSSGTGFFDSNTNPFLYETCALIFDPVDAGGTTVMFWAFRAADDLRFLNTSIHCINGASGGNQRILFGYVFDNTRYVRARGCAFSWDTTNALNLLCAVDNGGTPTDAAHHDFLDCAYRNYTVFSENPVFDTQAEWLANVDTAGIFPSAAMFPNAPTALSLTPTSSIWALRRTTSAVVPTFGINDAYDGHYGAYQYPPAVDRAGRAYRTQRVGRL